MEIIPPFSASMAIRHHLSYYHTLIPTQLRQLSWDKAATANLWFFYGFFSVVLAHGLSTDGLGKGEGERKSVSWV